jgi:oxygen-independent coproporphyrinogen-3 oxidase
LLAKARQRVDEIGRLQAEGLICLDGDFVPSVHYPPITQYPFTTDDELFAGYTPPQDGFLDVYVHFPFCEQRCTFCHYPGKLGQQTEEKNRYLAALEKEMDIYMRRLGIDKIKARSILIGGGTATFLSPEQLKRFLQFFCKRVDLTHCRQFNYDVDPGTLVGQSGLERLRIMKDYGVNRLTIGVQSLDDSVLTIMNRPHNAQTAIESIENSRKFGFQLNIEFIFGHPGETMENWIDVIEKAVTLPVDEIQLYRLKVLAYGDLQGHIIKLREKDPTSIPSFEDTMMMKQIAIDILSEHGFHENLRRVYSKKKEHFSHYAYNQCCMLYDQIGLGLTAFSSLRDRFALNTQYFHEYYARIEEGKLPINRGLIRSKETQVRWAIVLPLKNSDLKKAYFEKVTGVSFDTIFRKKVERLKQFGLIEENDEIVRLTELGAFVADEVAEQFNSNEFMPVPIDAYAQGPLHPYADNTSEDALGHPATRRVSAGGAEVA